MSQTLDELRSSEKDLILKAPLLVGMLIAGADGIINSREQKKLSNFLYSRARKYGDEMEAIFQKLINNLNMYLIEFMHSYPRDHDERNREIVKKLGQLNEILPKLDKTFAYNYYHSLRDIAKKTAKASGGILKTKPVRKTERKFVLLSMILNPGEPQTQEPDTGSGEDSQVTKPGH